MKIIGKTAIEISDSVRQLVESGELNPGNSLPPVRELAEQLGVNRNTVAAAYQKLTQADIVISQGRAGTVIRQPAKAGEQEGLSLGTALIDMADGNPNPEYLPDPRQLFGEANVRCFLYGEETILPDLNTYGRDWLGNDCPPGMELELTHGALDAIERLCVAHLVQGDKVAVEDPGFMGTIGSIKLAGMRTVGIEIDDFGMKPDSLQMALNLGVRAVLITPRAHNPTGCSLNATRAQELKGILASHPNVLVIMDDHFALVANSPFYSIIPETTLRWALIRSVSKGLGPDLRVAFVGCDKATADRLRARLAPGMNWVSHLLQALVLSCLTSKKIISSLKAAQSTYTENRLELIQALRSEGIEVTSTVDGLNVWIPVSEDQKTIAYELAKKGWLVRSGNAFEVQRPSNAVRVTISKLNPGQAGKFVKDFKFSHG
ncbi:transcriptional regulator PtsJ [Methylobacillus methanolivorans]|uniref:Transcriptional regulator PtsJ n=1 Tax=Methylobacillus methanolivorans TaxID=1848927 RepID=A0ABW8GKS8_9PROT